MLCIRFKLGRGNYRSNHIIPFGKDGFKDLLAKVVVLPGISKAGRGEKGKGGFIVRPYELLCQAIIIQRVREKSIEACHIHKERQPKSIDETIRIFQG
jgi:hypothetical protein